MKIKVLASVHKSAANINHLIGEVFEAKKTSNPAVVEIDDDGEVIPLFEGEWEEVKSAPVTYSEIRSGMNLWDSKTNKWAGVLRVYLWKDIIAENPNRYYLKEPKEANHG